MLSSHCCLHMSIPETIIANCMRVIGRSAANNSCAPALYTCITCLFMSPSTMRSLLASVLCNVLLWCCHISHETFHIVLINSAVHLCAEHLDLIHCQYCSCCVLHCSISTPSKLSSTPICLESVWRIPVPVECLFPPFTMLVST